MRTSVITPYASYLRVYEPLEAFDASERRQWEAYVASGCASDHVRAVASERRQALANLAATPPVTVPARESREAYVIVRDGGAYLCPWQVRLRSWFALLDFQRGMPANVLEAFVPRVVLEQESVDFGRWREEHPDTARRILTNTWHVPLRWFVPFSHEERLVDLGPDRALIYRTPMVEARRRLARALHVLRRTIEDGPITVGIIDLGRWLEEFHPRSIVELDYGGLVHLLDDLALLEDRSAEDVAEALGALAAGEPEPAAAAYRRLLERWRVVQALEHAS